MAAPIPCSRTRSELDSLLKEARLNSTTPELFSDHFFNPVRISPDERKFKVPHHLRDFVGFQPDIHFDDASARCQRCGCTIDRHRETSNEVEEVGNTCCLPDWVFLGAGCDARKNPLAFAGTITLLFLAGFWLNKHDEKGIADNGAWRAVEVIAFAIVGAVTRVNEWLAPSKRWVICAILFILPILIFTFGTTIHTPHFQNGTGL